MRCAQFVVNLFMSAGHQLYNETFRCGEVVVESLRRAWPASVAELDARSYAVVTQIECLIEDTKPFVVRDAVVETLLARHGPLRTASRTALPVCRILARGRPTLLAEWWLRLRRGIPPEVAACVMGFLPSGVWRRDRTTLRGVHVRQVTRRLGNEGGFNNEGYRSTFRSGCTTFLRPCRPGPDTPVVRAVNRTFDHNASRVRERRRTFPLSNPGVCEAKEQHRWIVKRSPKRQRTVRDDDGVASHDSESTAQTSRCELSDGETTHSDCSCVHEMNDSDIGGASD